VERIFPAVLVVFPLSYQIASRLCPVFVPRSKSISLPHEQLVLTEKQPVLEWTVGQGEKVKLGKEQFPRMSIAIRSEDGNPYESLVVIPQIYACAVNFVRDHAKGPFRHFQRPHIEDSETH
jgi:hypothetical protein